MSETIRGIPSPFAFASVLAFPPENLITLLAPNFFGEPGIYWGRGYLWETCIFIGVTGVLLALYAVIYCGCKAKWTTLVLFVCTLLLALGAHTPLYRVLYDFVPGFNKFRSVSKFIFTASLFLALLAALGFDRLLRRKRAEAGFIAGAFLLAALLGGGAYWTATTSAWRPFMDSIHNAGESFFLPQFYASAELGAHWQHRATTSVVIAATTCGTFAALLVASKWNARALYGIAVIGAAEMFWFAYSARPSFDSTSVIDRGEKLFLDAHPGEYRILNRFNPNSAMLLRVPDLWGYDASVVRRYAEFVAWSQGGNPDKATQDVNFTRIDPLFAMVRLRYVLLPPTENSRLFEVETPPLPHLLLVSKYRIANDRDTIFNAMHSPDFDPTTMAILESEPSPAP